MFRCILFLFAFSTINGILIGFHFQHVLQHQAFLEFSHRVNLGDKGIEDVEFVPPKQWKKSAPFFCQIFQDFGRPLEHFIDEYVQFMLHQLSSSNKSRLEHMDLVALSNEAHIANRYQASVDALISCAHGGFNREATKYAISAIKLREYAFVHSSKEQENHLSKLSRYGFFERDVVFAESLMAVGEYQQALEVLVSQSPLENMHPGRRAQITAYRQNALGEAYLGLKRYTDAITILKEPVPSLSEKSSSLTERKLSLAMAHLATSDAEAATTEVHRIGKLQDVAELTIPIKKIPNSNDDEAIAISRSLIAYLGPHPDDITAAPLLDAFSNIMQTYKHEKAASMLSDEAEIMRLN